MLDLILDLILNFDLIFLVKPGQGLIAISKINYKAR